jgi:hypothetical protein
MALSYDVAKTYRRVRRHAGGFAQAARAQPVQMDGKLLPLRFVVVRDVDFLPDELANLDRYRVRACARPPISK